MDHPICSRGEGMGLIRIPEGAMDTRPRVRYSMGVGMRRESATLEAAEPGSARPNLRVHSVIITNICSNVKQSSVQRVHGFLTLMREHPGGLSSLSRRLSSNLVDLFGIWNDQPVSGREATIIRAGVEISQ